MIKIPILFYAPKSVVSQDPELAKLMDEGGITESIVKEITFVNIDYFFESSVVEPFIGRRAIIVASGGSEFTSTFTLKEVEDAIRRNTEKPKNTGILAFFTKRSKNN